MIKKRLLLVDDDAQNLDILKEVFEDEYDLEEARDGQEALIKYSAFKPDVILLDFMMPNMNGRDFLKAIRQKEEAEGRYIGKGAVPVIMLTAYKDPWVSLFKEGCDFFITKPFEATKLRSKIKEVLAQAGKNV